MKIINEKLLDLFRLPGRCEWCRQWCVRCEPHHLRAKGMGGGRRFDVRINLIALGRSDDHHPCHTVIHNDGIREQVLEIVADREGTTPEAIGGVMDLLIRLPKNPRPWQVARELGAVDVALLRRVFAEAGLSELLEEAA